MPTQLEILIDALKGAGRPMTAAELADVLRESGTDAERPVNTVFSLVHRCPGIVSVGGSPARYALKSNACLATEPKNGTGAIVDSPEFFGALEAVSVQIRKSAKKCSTEGDVKSKLVEIPVLRNLLGYGDDMLRFENRGIDGAERPDIVVGSERKARFIVEVKRLGSDLSKAEPQLERYFRNMASPAPVGIITDGVTWKFYLRTLRNTVPIAVQYAEGTMGRPDPDFADALSDLACGGFSRDILVSNSKSRAARFSVIRGVEGLRDYMCRYISKAGVACWKKYGADEAVAEAMRAVDRWAERKKSAV